MIAGGWYGWRNQLAAAPGITGLNILENDQYILFAGAAVFDQHIRNFFDYFCLLLL
jgi:hypothetical protein